VIELREDGSWLKRFELVASDGRFFKGMPECVRVVKVPPIVNADCLGLSVPVGPHALKLATYGFHCSHDASASDRYLMWCTMQIEVALANGLLRGRRVPRGALSVLRPVARGATRDPVFFGWQNGDWCELGGYGERWPIITKVFKFLRSLELTERYLWSVKFRGTSRKWLVFGTTPDASKQAFRLRDIPDGKRRRAAMLNWIDEYSRRSQVAEGPHQVSGHLRGSEQFTIDGIECRIDPPAWLREKLEAGE
jgi:hypothetical protein